MVGRSGMPAQPSSGRVSGGSDCRPSAAAELDLDIGLVAEQDHVEIAAVDGSALGKGGRVQYLYVGMPHVPRTVRVLGIEPLDVLTSQLDVLLHHRPRSISRRRGGRIWLCTAMDTRA